MPLYQITPGDVLFFRDGRPMDATGGHGVQWPLPSLFFDAIHAALYRALGDSHAEWEHIHRIKGSDERQKRFGSLATAGPFPIQEGQWLFPAPADLSPDANTLAYAPLPVDERNPSDLPAPLTMTVAPLIPPSKQAPKTWITKSALEAVLAGQDPSEGRHAAADLYDGEWTTGIGMDSETQTQDGERIYSAEYMRLKDGVHLGAWATLPLKKRNGEEGMHELLSEGSILIMGGQQRACSVKLPPGSLEQHLPVAPAVTGTRVKWCLLSPAVFPAIGDHPGGWLPTWVDHRTGQVMLRRGPGGGKARRKGLTEGAPLDVRLVAAQIPKPVAFSGWNVQANAAKPTQLAVPAGAVYFFEGPDAPVLADLLNWHGPQRTHLDRIVNRRSSIMGEKGFGIGVCGEWKPHKEQKKRV